MDILGLYTLGMEARAYARPLLLFLPRLRKADVSNLDVRRVTQDNPRRFLTVVPKEV
jgi:predicted metal-dependent phosphotriesterase family hydrolase